jgi:hypothetical protein
MPLTRRTLLQTCASFSTYALVAELANAKTLPQALPARRWLSHQSDLAVALSGGKISPAGCIGRSMSCRSRSILSLLLTS